MKHQEKQTIMIHTKKRTRTEKLINGGTSIPPRVTLDAFEQSTVASSNMASQLALASPRCCLAPCVCAVLHGFGAACEKDERMRVTATDGEKKERIRLMALLNSG
jgi:hypothetical protein